MKKQVIILLFFLITLSSCKANTSSVDVFIYDENDPYVYAFGEMIRDKSNNEFHISYSENSQTKQNSDITNAIENGSKLMIINPVDRLSTYATIEKLKQANIPAIFFNREPLKKDLDLWDQVYYIGAPAEQPGIIQAHLIIDLFGNNPQNLNELDKNNDNIIQLVIIKGEQGHQDAEARTSSVIDEFILQGFSIETLTIQVANWNRESAKSAMQEIIDEFGNSFEVVISNNDAMALGAITTLLNNEYFIDDNQDGSINQLDESWIPVVGVDGLDEAVTQIEKGYMYGTVINDSEAMSDAMIELANALINGTPLEDLSYEIIDNTYIWINYREFIKE